MSPQPSAFHIRTIGKGDPVFPQVQELMESTWSQDSLIPVHLTLTFLKNGGLLLGGFEGDRLIAFSLGFPGFDGNQAYLCSHMLAVSTEYRHRRIGEQMKWHQRSEALKMGYTKMVWTYDPLESVNSYFNLTKLGVGISVVAIIVGQMIMSMAIDHFGWFGGKRIPFDMTRFFGTILLFAALWLIFRGSFKT